MRRLIIFAAAAATLAIVAGVSAETVQGILNPEETRTITNRVQKVRALTFEHPVPFSYLTVDQTPYVAAADGWASDRFTALQKSTDVTLVWIVAFQNRAQAENFTSLYPQILAKSLPGLTARHVEQNGNTVLILIGDGTIRFHELAPAIWKESAIARHPITNAAIT